MTENSRPGVVIVGSSHAAAQLAHGLRRHGWRDGITIVGAERELPYHRPPLSKDFLKGKKSFNQILLRQKAMYEKECIGLVLGRRVIHVDRNQKCVTTDDGELLAYDKLVLTTGARPRRLPVPGAELPGVCYVRTVADIRCILEKVSRGGKAVIIGGGYIGLEAAASLRGLGMDVTVLEAQERVLQRITCPQMSAFFTRVHREEGVVIQLGTSVKAIEGDKFVTGVRLKSGEMKSAELVVVGIGVVPEVSLAEQCGLEVNNGVVVDQYGRTKDPDVYAAGDCASFVHPLYKRFIRLESVQNANDQAMTVANSICGDPEPYAALPWFWSDQFNVKLQIAGLSEGHDVIVERGDSKSGRSFSICYLRDGRLLAVDAVNRPKDFIMSKKLIARKLPLDEALLRDIDNPLDACGHRASEKPRNR